MMECTEARESILEADLEELRGEVDTPLARHIAGCGACARIAGVILMETARLDDALRARSPVPDLAPVVRRADLVAERGRAPGRVRRAATAVLAVAAAAAALWLLPVDPPTDPRPDPSSSASPPLVEAAPGQDVAILPTRNPDITVVVFF